MGIAEDVERRATELTSHERKVELEDDFVRDCLNANERGDGTLYASINRGMYLYNVSQADGEWLRWNQHVWEVDEFRDAQGAVELCALEYQYRADELEAQIEKEGLEKKRGESTPWKITLAAKYRSRVDRLRTDNGAKKVLVWAPIVDRSMACRDNELNRHPTILPCANGVIDLPTGALINGNPADMMTMAIDVPYCPEVGQKRAQDFVLEICGSEEMAEFIQRSFGYAISGYSHEQHIWVFIGQGRNGKGVLFSCIADVMGPFFHVINSGMLMEQKVDPPPSAASEHKHSLRCKRIIVGSETKQGKRIDAEQVKMMTGDDAINCRPNFGKEVVFRPTHTLFLQTNHMPTGLAGDFALVQRLLKIDFPWAYVDDPAEEGRKNPSKKDIFRKKNPRLKEELLSGTGRQQFLNWLVEGYRKYIAQGIDPPQQVREGVDELSREENYMDEFLADCLVDTDIPGSRVRSKTISYALRWWISNNRATDAKRAKSIKEINRYLRETRGYQVEKAGGVYYVLGVTFNLEVANEIAEFINHNKLE